MRHHSTICWVMILKPWRLNKMPWLFVEAAARCQTADWRAAFPIPHLWTQLSREKTDLRPRFTGLLICSPQVHTQIYGSVYFLPSEVERGCSRAGMKQRGLMCSLTSAPVIPLHMPSPLTLTLPSPSFLSPFCFPLPPLSSLRCLFRFITCLPLPLVSSRALSPSRGGSNLPERATLRFWMRWHPPWCGWREVRGSRMRCRADVGPPITHGRGETCGHITVLIITAFTVGRPGVPVLVLCVLEHLCECASCSVLISDMLFKEVSYSLQQGFYFCLIIKADD